MNDDTYRDEMTPFGRIASMPGFPDGVVLMLPEYVQWELAMILHYLMVGLITDSESKELLILLVAECGHKVGFVENIGGE